MKKVDFSIIIPAYNEEKYISRTIESVKSVLNSSEFTFEILVIDNASTDRTVETARALGAKVFSNPVRSIAITRNLGAQKAQGAYLLFIDADTLLSKKLFNRAQFAISRSGFKCVSTITSFDKYLSLSSFGVWFYNILSLIFKLGVGQFILIKKVDFDYAKGFNPKDFGFEDVKFFRKLGEVFGKSSISILNTPVISSGRKFKNNSNSFVFIIQLLGIILGYKIGTDKSKLDFWYNSGATKTSYKKYLALLVWFLLVAKTYFIPANSAISVYDPFLIPIIFLLLAVLFIRRLDQIFPLMFVAFVMILVEAIGTLTGFPFGSFYYNSRFGSVGFMGVPLFIGLAWVLVVGGLTQLLRNPFLVGTFSMVFDFYIEHFAVSQGYWYWEIAVPFGAPVQNYLSWGIISFVLSLYFSRFKLDSFYSLVSVLLILGFIISTLNNVGFPYVTSGVVFILILILIGLHRLISDYAD